MLETIAITLLIIAISVAFLSVRILFGKRFVHTHIDGNKALNRKGIHCVQAMDKMERKANSKRVNEKNKNQ